MEVDYQTLVRQRQEVGKDLKVLADDAVTRPATGESMVVSLLAKQTVVLGGFIVN